MFGKDRSEFFRVFRRPDGEIKGSRYIGSGTVFLAIILSLQLPATQKAAGYGDQYEHNTFQNQMQPIQFIKAGTVRNPP